MYGRCLGPMDLVLLSPHPLPLPSTPKSFLGAAPKPSSPNSMLGLVQGVSYNAQGVKLTHMILPTALLSVLTPTLPRSKEGVYKLHCVFVEAVRPLFRDFEAMHEVGETSYWQHIQGESSGGEGLDMPSTPPPPDSPPVSPVLSSQTNQTNQTSAAVPIGPAIASLTYPAPIMPSSVDDSPPSDLPAPFLTYLHTSFNPSQRRAIWAVVRAGREGSEGKARLALIQGPPGTGMPYATIASSFSRDNVYVHVCACMCMYVLVCVCDMSIMSVSYKFSLSCG